MPETQITKQNSNQRCIMKRKLGIQQKIQIYILSSVALIFIISLGYTGWQSKEKMLSVSRDLADTYAREYANRASDELNYYADAALFLQSVFEGYTFLPHNRRREILSNYLKTTLRDNPKFLSVWSILEPDALDTLKQQYKNKVGSTILGNFRYVYYRQDDEIVLSRYVEQDPEAVLSGNVYSLVKQRMQITVVDPYYYSYSGNKSDEILETNIVSPVIENDNFLGVVGIDVPLITISEQINQYQPIEGSFAFLLSHHGQIVSFPEENAIGKNLNDIGFISNDSLDLNALINSGETYSYYTNYDNQKYYITAAPVKITGTSTSWYVNMALPESHITENALSTIYNALLVALAGLIFLAIIITMLARKITRPIKKLTHVMDKISQGDVSTKQKLNISTGDEINDMAIALNKYIDGYTQKTHFASRIGDGELDEKLDLLSDEDKLGKSLMQMRDNLKKARQEEEKRKEEDKKHRWTNEGIAKFADILRQNNDNIKKLSFELMRNLINYLEVNQGALFVIEEEEKTTYYEAKSTIAFNRRQFNKTRFKIGEDIIGRCAHEGKTIYLKEVPEDFIKITSGMGEARPNTLLIVPAVLNDKVYAIMELASFRQLEAFEIEFVEKIGESVASTIANVKVSERTQELLKESQHQQEELGSQEEEMRQNLEELQTTQEEASRREFELRNLIEALSVANYMVEYDMHGIITEVNERFATLVGLAKEQIIGMNHRDGLKMSGLNKQNYSQFWEDLRHGHTRTEETRIEYNERELYLYETYTPVLDKDDIPYKVVKIAVDITELKNAQAKIEKQKAALSAKDEKIETLELQKNTIEKQLEEERKNSQRLAEELKHTPQRNVKAGDPEAKLDQDAPQVVLPPAGEPLIAFVPEMENAIGELNDQHHRIVELINEVYIGLRTDKPKKEIKETLKMLVDFTAWHFSNEERYFEEYKFENTESHKASHKAFIDHIDGFRKKYQAGRIKFYDDVMRFLKAWIENHFATEDQEYVELFKSKGL